MQISAGQALGVCLGVVSEDGQAQAITLPWPSIKNISPEMLAAINEYIFHHRPHLVIKIQDMSVANDDMAGLIVITETDEGRAVDVYHIEQWGSRRTLDLSTMRRHGFDPDGRLWPVTTPRLAPNAFVELKARLETAGLSFEHHSLPTSPLPSTPVSAALN